VDWYNDSKATNENEGATCAAIRGLADKRLLVLIAGGIAKGTDFTQLRRLARGRLRALVVLGKDGPRLARAMNGVAPIVVARDMHDAVVRARHLARPGDAVLLSPACASGDLSEDYVERGEA
jgi:UDP-N-acetylmuramoylalanine--D-glutamate ligase